MRGRGMACCGVVSCARLRRGEEAGLMLTFASHGRRYERSEDGGGHLSAVEWCTHARHTAVRRSSPFPLVLLTLAFTLTSFPLAARAQIHYLCSHTYSSTTLHPTLDLPPSITDRDSLLAAALLASSSTGEEGVDGETERRKAMSGKMRFVKDLKAQAGRGDGGGGCLQCREEVRV